MLQSQFNFMSTNYSLNCMTRSPVVLINHFKDIQEKIFQSKDFFNFLLQSDNELLVSEMPKKLWVTKFISEMKHVENYPDFEKLACVDQHGLQGFELKISKMNHQRQAILVMFSISASIALAFSNVANVLTKLASEQAHVGAHASQAQT